MRLAWKELMYSKKKYILIELIIVLLVFMVLFLSGLVVFILISIASSLISIRNIAKVDPMKVIGGAEE